MLKNLLFFANEELLIMRFALHSQWVFQYRLELTGKDFIIQELCVYNYS